MHRQSPSGHYLLLLNTAWDGDYEKIFYTCQEGNVYASASPCKKN